MSAITIATRGYIAPQPVVVQDVAGAVQVSSAAQGAVTVAAITPDNIVTPQATQGPPTITSQSDSTKVAAVNDVVTIKITTCE